MAHLLHFLIQHGYFLLFGLVLAEQCGLPIPAVPGLLAMGALIGRGGFHFGAALAAAVAACLAADSMWFTLGYYRGASVLRFVCRLSLEPDSCVRRTSDLFARFGLRSLLVAKFVPGLSTVATPMAGLARTPARRFLVWDLAGSLVWAGAFLALGRILAPEIERAAEWSLRLGSWLIVAAVSPLAAYIAWKYTQRVRLLRSLRVDRITPHELRERLEAGEAVTIVDLRHAIDYAAAPMRLPGAIRLDPASLAASPGRLPPGREVVLYCS